MRQRFLGGTGIAISEIGFGCMPLSEFYGSPPKQDQAIQLLRDAYEGGISLFDTADMYGRGQNEVLLGIALGPNRHRVCIATKAGITRSDAGTGSNGDPAYLIDACNQSLRRLATDYIDLFQYHRVDRNVSLMCSLEAFYKLFRAGKIRSIGLSNVNVEELESALTVVPIASVQNEASLVQQRDFEAVIPWCQRNKVTYLAYSPLGRGALAGKQAADLADTDYRKRVRYFSAPTGAWTEALGLLREIARKRGATIAAIALAWLRQVATPVVPIPSATCRAQLLNNIESTTCELSAEELNELGTQFGSIF